ncbi:MAG: hypothetical protein APF81_11265 [Desulfosporosinus sp. BRH_c37]|nr:MAG: hypothetical protein APF81_11265 [Desulfosporosinus sp. BRH_c37]
MLTGCFLLAIVYPLYFLFHSVPDLVVTRLIHGAGIACFATASSILVTEISPKNRLAQAIGIYVVSTSIATGIAPAIGLSFMQNLPTQLFFAIPAVFALIAFVMVATIDTRRPTLCEKQTSISFANVLTNKHVLIPGITWVSCSFTLGVVNAFLPLYLLPFSNVSTSLFYAIYSIALILIRFLGSGLSNKFGRKKVVIPSMLLLTLGVLGLAFVQEAISLSICAMVYGFGIGLTYPSIVAQVIDHVDGASRSIALGIFSASIEIGYFLGPLIMGITSEVLGFRGMFVLSSLVPLVGMMFFWYNYRNNFEPPRPLMKSSL